LFSKEKWFPTKPLIFNKKTYVFQHIHSENIMDVFFYYARSPNNRYYLSDYQKPDKFLYSVCKKILPLYIHNNFTIYTGK